MTREDRLLFFENWGSICWFIMDSLWMFDTGLALMLILPAFVLSFATFAFCKRDMDTLAINSALNCWLMMNICWMVSDIKSVISLMVLAKMFFIFGIIFLIITFLIPGNPEIRFKRFRFFSSRN